MNSLKFWEICLIDFFLRMRWENGYHSHPCVQSWSQYLLSLTWKQWETASLAYIKIIIINLSKSPGFSVMLRTKTINHKPKQDFLNCRFSSYVPLVALQMLSQASGKLTAHQDDWQVPGWPTEWMKDGMNNTLIALGPELQFVAQHTALVVLSSSEVWRNLKIVTY